MAIPAPLYPTKQTIREQIVQAIRERLARISLANRYATDIGTNLWYGQMTTPEPHVLPIIYYWDHFETPSALIGSQVMTVQVQVESYDRVRMPDDLKNEIEDAVLVMQQMPVVCNQQLADLKIALTHDARSGQYDVKFGGLAHGLHYTESDPFFGIQPDLAWCGINSQWVITYQHAPGDPYSLKRA